MRFISTSLFFAILTLLLLHVTAAAPLPQGPNPTPFKVKTWWQKYRAESHERTAVHKNEIAGIYWDRAHKKANDPKLSEEKRNRESKRYNDKGDGAAVERDRHAGKADKYRKKLQASKRPRVESWR
jgi:hypothetical protein